MFLFILFFSHLSKSEESIATLCYDKISYELYENKSASAVKLCNNTEQIRNIVFPDYIEYGNDKYTVISIKQMSGISGTLKLPASLMYIYDQAGNVY